MTEAAISAMTELYRAMALKFARTLSKHEGEFDVAAIFSARPYTEDEAEAEAGEMTAEFERVVRERHRQGLEDAYLLLGCDLIADLPQRK